ncbi:MAG: glycosyltransferase family 39 protein [Planctomycetota bacterium]
MIQSLRDNPWFGKGAGASLLRARKAGEAVEAPVATEQQPASGSKPTASPNDKPKPWQQTVVFTLVLLAVAATARLAYPVEGGHFDEYYHLLAARGVLAGEGLAIGDSGYYPRAAMYTYAVAGSMAVFGDSEWAGRLPSVLCGIGIVLLLGLWAWRQAGPRAGWATGLIAAGLPVMIQLSTICRFYTMHVLLVLIAAWAVYRVLDTRFGIGWLRVGGLSGLAVTCLALAYPLQKTTLVVAVILAGWVMATWARRGLSPMWAGRRQRYLVMLTAACGLGLVVLAVGWQLGVLGEQWTKYRAAAVWSQGKADDYKWYHRWMLERYGLLYLGLPLLVVAGMVRNFRLVAFALWVFVAGMLAQSLGGMKAERYLSYAMPFLVLIWGIGLAELLPQVVRLADWVVRRIAGRKGEAGEQPVGWLPRVAATTGIVLGVLAPLFYNTYALRMLPRMYDRKVATTHPYVEPVWRNVLDELRVIRAEAGAGSVLVTPSGVKALYHLGELDYTLSKTQLEGFTEGGVDPRLGRPTISTPESLAAVMAKHPSGLVLAEHTDWGKHYALTSEVAALIESKMERVELSDPEFLLFRWGGSQTVNRPADRRVAEQGGAL